MGNSQCNIDGCIESVLAAGYCGVHYRKKQRYGDPLHPGRFGKVCSVDGCDEKHAAAGLCSKHYKRVRRNGHLDLVRIYYGHSLEERFWMKVEKSPSGCWLWLARTTKDGYGEFTLGESNVRAHRLAYGFLIGEIPEGFHLDHLCSNRRCVNPEHLEPVTPAENNRRAYVRRKARESNGWNNRCTR